MGLLAPRLNDHGRTIEREGHLTTIVVCRQDTLTASLMEIKQRAFLGADDPSGDPRRPQARMQGGVRRARGASLCAHCTSRRFHTVSSMGWRLRVPCVMVPCIPISMPGTRRWGVALIPGMNEQRRRGALLWRSNFFKKLVARGFHRGGYIRDIHSTSVTRKWSRTVTREE
jgi:hypothetical protein